MDIKYTLMKIGHWLKKTNAQAVLTVLLVLLLAVSGLWVAALMSDVRTPPSQINNRARTNSQLPLGVLKLIASVEDTLRNSFPSVSPFAGAPSLPRRVARPHRPANITENFFDRFKRPPKRTNTPQLNRPETVSLVYKGIFKRSDGVSMALIQDSKSGRSSFYQTSGDVFGMTLGDIEAETIKIVQENGEELELKRNESAVFVEGRHAP